MSSSFQHHAVRHVGLPCPSLSPGIAQTHVLEAVTPSNHCPLLFLPSIFPSIRIFSNESAFRIRWPKYWSFSFSISPFNEYSGLISFRSNWFDLLAVQGTPRVFSNTTVLKLQLFNTHFLRVQLSHPHMTTGKIIILTLKIWPLKIFIVSQNLNIDLHNMSTHVWWRNTQI